MLRYALRRLLIAVPLALGASFIIFWAISVSGDPLTALESRPSSTPEQIDFIRRSRGLDQPIHVQYWLWLSSIPGDGFGTYLLNRNPIWPDLRRVLGNTLQLVIAAEAIAFVCAVTLGTVAARRQYGPFDYATTALSYIAYALPSFALALILQVTVVQIFLGTGVRLFPIANLSSVDPGTGLAFWIDRAHHLVLPVLSLATFSVATYSRYMRASLLDALSADHVRTARAKGLRERRVLTRHAVRNALIPTVTVATVSFGTLMSGAIVIEQVFALDGMGSYFLRELSRRDPYPVMAWLLVVAGIVILFNLLADLLYGYLDPRIRYDR